VAVNHRFEKVKKDCWLVGWLLLRSYLTLGMEKLEVGGMKVSEWKN